MTYTLFPDTPHDGKLSPDYVQGLRAWWKKVIDPAKFTQAKTPDDVLGELSQVNQEILRLREHLLYGLGMLPVGSKDYPTLLDKDLRNKIPPLIEDALEFLEELKSRVKWVRNMTDPES